VVAAILQVLVLLVLPWGLIKLTKVLKRLNFVSPIVICYVVGIVLANLPFIPLDSEISMLVSTAMVPLAIPMILFSTDFKSWLKLAPKTILSFVLVLVCSVSATLLAALIFHNQVPEYWKLSGMLVGVYTGGTPNLMAVGVGVRASNELLGAANVSDMLICSVYFIFLVTIAKWLLSKFLPPFIKKEKLHLDQRIHDSLAEVRGANQSYDRVERFRSVLAAVGLGLAVVAVAAGAAYLIVGGDFDRIEIPVILLVTTIAIGLSFIPKVRAIKGTYETGGYLLLVFSLAIGTTANIQALLSQAPIILAYTGVVVASAVILHFALAALFRIDTDTTIITSTAGIYGPAFVGPIAAAIKNKEVVVSGMICGLVGYAVGNYLGFAVATLLMPK
jgi:uncharacterized membrane protein